MQEGYTNSTYLVITRITSLNTVLTSVPERFAIELFQRMTEHVRAKTVRANFPRVAQIMLICRSLRRALLHCKCCILFLLLFRVHGRSCRSSEGVWKASDYVQVLSNIQSRTGYRLDLYSLRSFRLVLLDAALAIRDDNVSAKSVRKTLLAHYRPKPDALALIMQISRSLIHSTEPPSLSPWRFCIF